MLHLSLERLPSPIGMMLLLSDERQRLRALDWQDHEARLQVLLRRQYGADIAIKEMRGRSPACSALEAYFAGELKAIDAIAVQTGGTAFQKKVWSALRRMPAGTTMSYAQMAAKIGSPAAVRATGAANGANPVSIVVPCHRLVGSDGRLVKYGGGLERKQWLLRHEGAAHEGAA
ncbi:MAG: methylated-DNA--[protein]-cysteine S-methyltransferase [Reyranellaceae bacterium]